MSGNSSVCRRQSANSPNTTSATIVTTVIIGRLIAKSEIIIESAPPTAVRWRTSRRCRDPNEGSRSYSLGRAKKKRVARLYARQYLDRFRSLVSEADLYLNLFRLSLPHPHHGWNRSAHVDRGLRNYEAQLCCGGHPAVREQPADERASFVWNRDVNANLASRR